MTALVKRAKNNFGRDRFSKYLPNSEVTSEVSSDGSKGFAQIEGKRLGTQNKGATVKKRTPKRGKALKFTLKRISRGLLSTPRGTLVPNSLDSRKPEKGTVTVFSKSAEGFKIKAGRWDRANKKDVLENLTDIIKEA